MVGRWKKCSTAVSTPLWQQQRHRQQHHSLGSRPPRLPPPTRPPPRFHSLVGHDHQGVALAHHPRLALAHHHSAHVPVRCGAVWRVSSSSSGTSAGSKRDRRHMHCAGECRQAEQARGRPTATSHHPPPPPPHQHQHTHLYRSMMGMRNAAKASRLVLSMLSSSSNSGGPCSTAAVEAPGTDDQ